MFDIGWGELFLIGVVALIVVGPKDLPALFRTVGNFTGKARVMAREFQRSLEQAANEAGMSEMQKSLRSIDQGLNTATESARRFAKNPVRTAVSETVMKPKASDTTPEAASGTTPDAASGTTPDAASGTTAAPSADSAASEPARPAPEPAPVEAPSEGEERAAGR